MSFILGFITALFIIAVITLPRTGKFFFVQNRTKLSFDDTLKTIRQNIEGNSNHSYLISSAYPVIATFMPAAIAGVGRKNGIVDLYRKNTGIIGLFFSGAVNDVMRCKVPVEMNKLLEGVI